MSYCWTLFVALFILAVSLTQAEPPHFRTIRFNNRNNVRFLARQEAAPTPAAGGAASAAPSPAPYPAAGVTPAIPFEEKPDQTYGPPTPAAAAEAVTEPDNKYGTPTATPRPDLVSQNLIQPRSRLRVVAPLSLPSDVEIIRSQPVIVYTLQ